MPADIILKNANVITMNPARPRAGLVATEDVSIMAVTGSEEEEALTGKRTRVIDCEGKTLVPGFNDAHLHIFSLMRALLAVDVSPAAVRTLPDIKEAVRQKAAATPPGSWINGTGLDEFHIEGNALPSKSDLDEAAPEHPVLLVHRSLHACVLNSRALALAGITPDTPEAPGTRIERDLDTGEPNGILYEMVGTIRREVMPPFTEDELDEGIALMDDLFLSQGITSVQDATVSNNIDRWETVCDFVLNEQLHTRTTMMAGAPYWQEFKERRLKTGTGDDLMRLGPVKLMTGGLKACMAQSQEELNENARAAAEAGFRLAFHAIEEQDVASAVAALEYVAQHIKTAGKRHRIEHCSECPDALLKRIKALDAVVVIQPPFLYYSGERYLATVPDSLQPFLYRMRSLLAKGIVVAGSSDAPVVPNNPLYGIGAAVTRRAASGQVLQPQEAIPPELALELYTVNGAYASFEENIKGRLMPGQMADMVLLSADPTAVAPEEIRNINVEMTIIGGKVVWER